ELCFCLGAGKSQTTDPDDVRRFQTAFQNAKKRLSDLPPHVMNACERAFKRKWYFSKLWRMEDKVDDFSSLSEWLQFASKTNANGASISIYYSPDELQRIGENLQFDFNEAVETFAPIFAYVYQDSKAPDLSPLSTQATENGVVLQPEYS